MPSNNINRNRCRVPVFGIEKKRIERDLKKKEEEINNEIVPIESEHSLLDRYKPANTCMRQRISKCIKALRFLTVFRIAKWIFKRTVN